MINKLIVIINVHKNILKLIIYVFKILMKNILKNKQRIKKNHKFQIVIKILFVMIIKILLIKNAINVNRIVNFNIKIINY